MDMIFTAGFLMCIKNVPHSYQTCEIMRAPAKFTNEKRCWEVLNTQLQILATDPRVMYTYEPVNAKCTQWIPQKKETKESF
jgi:hypothetical protein|tara:strand:+ start:131 stop:373 length:243 start_codon:yes stop_codon:yes gene_type:complete